MQKSMGSTKTYAALKPHHVPPAWDSFSGSDIAVGKPCSGPTWGLQGNELSWKWPPSALVVVR